MASLTLKEWLADGPFTLALSSSFFGFYSHCGVATALFEKKLIPARITGSSAGALVGGALASGLDPETTSNLLFKVKREDFWDPRPGLGYLRGKKFLAILEENFVSNFAQATTPFEAAAFDLFSCRTRFLCTGALPRAVVASCAVPLLFHPVRIGSKLYVDGGVFHKSGINPRNGEERLLCIYLQGSGLDDSYEFGQSLRRLHKNHKILRFKNLPRLSYNSLEKGREAYTDAYRRLKKALARKVYSPLIDA